MLHRLREGQSGHLFVALSLVIGLALMPLSAAAQSGHATPSARDAKGKREVKFEVASIRPKKGFPGGWNLYPTPNGYASALNIRQAILIAYAPEDPMVWVGGGAATHVLKLPKWADDWYDVNARVSDADLLAWRNQSSNHELLRSAMRALLKERCKLVIHEQPTQVPDYKLVVQKKGARFKATPPGAALPSNGGKLRSGGIMVVDRRDGREVQRYYGATMGDLIALLNASTDRPIRDMTGLTGRYDFTVRQADELSHEMSNRIHNWPINHLGLELRPGKGPGLNLVIDHIEKPDPN